MCFFLTLLYLIILLAPLDFFPHVNAYHYVLHQCLLLRYSIKPINHWDQNYPYYIWFLLKPGFAQ